MYEIWGDAIMSKFEYGIPKLNSTVQKFEKVVQAAGQLLNQDKIKVLFGFESNINIIVDETALEKLDIDKKQFNKILNSEIMFLLECVLDDAEEFALSVPFTIRENKEKLSKIEKDKFENDIRSKINIIKEILVKDELKRRYLIKKYSKLSKINQLSWEINKKLFNSRNNDINFNYATVNIKLTKELEEEVIHLFPFLKSEYKIDEIHFDCDVYDINKLIEFFQEIKQKLEKIK